MSSPAASPATAAPLAPLASANPAPALIHLSIATPGIAEQVVFAGYDGVVIDMQHGEVGLELACTTLRSMPRGPWRYVRIDSIDSGRIGRLLDAGATGIIAPTVETVAATEALVAACKYPPAGGRSLGPGRPALYELNGMDLPSAANAAVSAVIQIESAAAVERAEQIFAVPGLDTVYVGPADLALTYGLTPRVDWTDGVVREAIEHMRALARANGLRFAVFCAAPAYAAALIRADLADWVGLGIDMAYISRTAAAVISELRKDQA